MPDGEPKKITTRLSQDAYKRFHAKALELGYDDMTFGEILLTYGISRWVGAVDLRTRQVQAREKGEPEPIQ